VYYYNGAQWYEQFLPVGRLYRTLILLGLALCLPNASVFSVFMVIYIVNIFCYYITSPFNEVVLSLDLVD